MIIGGIDPSFSCAGVAVMDTDKKQIRISDVRKVIGKKNFQNVFWTSVEVFKGVSEILNSLGNISIFVSETPYSGGQFSSGLHTLAGTMFLDYIYKYDLEKIYLISSRFITHVHKSNDIENPSKSDSTKLVRKGLLPIFEEYGYSFEYGNKYDEKSEFKGGLNNNSAEAFLLLCKLFINISESGEIDVSEELLDEIYSVARGMFDGARAEILYEKGENEIKEI